MIPVNYFAILVAALSSIVLGFLWYGPVFGKKWIALMNFTPENIEAGKSKSMAKSYAFMVLGSLLMAYVLSHNIIFGNAYLGASGASAGLTAAFWNWLGFIAPVTAGSVLWEGRSWKLWCFNNTYQLLALFIMGVILAVWK